ncbi:MAG: hypothetical protein KGS60_13555 [Verrucomicrobia bacterium]|nr:hypothetical protein [Verrucomicrobiota bacterium]
MRFFSFKPGPLLLLALTLLTGACSTPAPPNQPESLTATVRNGPFPPYETGALPPKTKILLLAGGSTLANFLQEVLDQRSFWIRSGYRPSEIACYYVRPDARHYLEDKEQFDDLAPHVRGFYQANPEQLYAHLSQLAAEAPPHFYLYTTSHGVAPSEELDDYALVYDADPLEFGTKVHSFIRPAELRNALNRLPAATSKTLVLQGCHAGGFVEARVEPYRSRTLRNVPNLCVLAASRHDRTSFGCGATDESTYYGSAYLAALREHKNQRIPQIDFEEVANAAVDRVEWMEQTHHVPFDKRSLPQFYTNRP